MIRLRQGLGAAIRLPPFMQVRLNRLSPPFGRYIIAFLLCYHYVIIGQLELEKIISWNRWLVNTTCVIWRCRALSVAAAGTVQNA
jgi:hypothetical protein